MKLIHKQLIINPVLTYWSGGKTKGVTRTVGPKGSEITYHVNPQDYDDFLKGDRNVTLPETIVTAADPKNYRSDFHPEDIGTFMNVATAGLLNRGSLSLDLHLLKDTYDAATGNKSWKDVANSAILGNSGVFKNPWANLALDVVVPTTGIGIYKLASLKNTAKNAVKNSTLVDDVTAMKNYEKLGAKPVTIDEADKLHYPDYIMPLYKIRLPKEVKEFYPEMLRRIKDNFNVDSKDLTESFSKQSETPIYIGKYDNPRYSGTHMMDTGESYVNLNDPDPISTTLHEAARHGTENTLLKYVPKAWEGYMDFINTLRPHMGHLITENSKDPAELRSTLGEVYLLVHKLVKLAYKNHASELPAEFGDESVNLYKRFGEITNHNINDILTDDDLLRMLELTNAYGLDYANTLKTMRAANQKLYNLTMNKLRELLTKYPMFTGAAAVGAGYGVTKHKNGGITRFDNPYANMALDMVVPTVDQYARGGHIYRIPKHRKVAETIKTTNGNILTREVDNSGYSRWFRNGKYITPSVLETYKFYDKNIGGYRQLKNGIDIRRHDSKGINSSTPVYTPTINNIESNSSKFIKRNIDISPKQQYKPNGKYITLKTKGNMNLVDIPTNMLDSIAINTGRSNTNIKTNLGLIGKESTFGGHSHFLNNPWSKNEIINPHILTNNHSYFTTPLGDYICSLYKYIPGYLDKDAAARERKAKEDLKHYNGIPNSNRIPHYSYNIMADAFKRYAVSPSNYNRGQGNYIPMVNAIGNEVWNEPHIQNWWNTEGKYYYNKGRSQGINYTYANGGTLDNTFPEAIDNHKNGGRYNENSY